jgi:hypothetical protein
VYRSVVCKCVFLRTCVRDFVVFRLILHPLCVLLSTLFSTFWVVVVGDNVDVMSLLSATRLSNCVSLSQGLHLLQFIIISCVRICNVVGYHIWLISLAFGHSDSLIGHTDSFFGHTDSLIGHTDSLSQSHRPVSQSHRPASVTHWQTGISVTQRLFCRPWMNITNILNRWTALDCRSLSMLDISREERKEGGFRSVSCQIHMSCQMLITSMSCVVLC